MIRINPVARSWKQRSGSSLGAVGEAAEQRKVEPLFTLVDGKNNLQISVFFWMMSASFIKSVRWKSACDKKIWLQILSYFY